jgi:hypothetical protein
LFLFIKTKHRKKISCFTWEKLFSAPGEIIYILNLKSTVKKKEGVWVSREEGSSVSVRGVTILLRGKILIIKREKKRKI